MASAGSATAIPPPQLCTSFNVNEISGCFSAVAIAVAELAEAIEAIAENGVAEPVKTIAENSVY